MENNTKLFLEARDYLLSTIEEKINVYLSGMWDPLCSFVLIRETNKLITEELHELFPILPKEHLPTCKFRIDNHSMELEVGIQRFLNIEPRLMFLGNVDVDMNNYDLYCRESWDPYFQYTFIARYGHDVNSVMKGSKTPAAEHMMGIQSPLSIAYHLALEEGYIM